MKILPGMGYLVQASSSFRTSQYSKDSSEIHSKGRDSFRVIRYSNVLRCSPSSEKPLEAFAENSIFAICKNNTGEETAVAVRTTPKAIEHGNSRSSSNNTATNATNQQQRNSGDTKEISINLPTNHASKSDWLYVVKVPALSSKGSFFYGLTP